MLVEKMKKEIDKKTEEQFTIICSSLRLDTERLTDLEKNYRILDDTRNRLGSMEVEVKKMRHLENEMF